MSQFSLFDDPVPVASPAPTAAPEHVPQPPAIVRAGTVVDSHPAGLKALRILPEDWVDVVITDEEFAARRPQFGPECSDDYVMLEMLEDRGVRVRPRENTTMRELYQWVEGDFIIRRRTLPGITVLVWQGPARKLPAKDVDGTIRPAASI
jgi:hypothetical protein